MLFVCLFFSSIYHTLEYKTAYQFSAHQFFISSIVFLVSCPPEWIKDDEMCYMYKGGSFTFTDAEKYCGVSAVDTDTLFMSFFLLFWLWVFFFFFFLFLNIYFSLLHSTFLYLVSICGRLNEMNFEVKWIHQGARKLSLGVTPPRAIWGATSLPLLVPRFRLPRTVFCSFIIKVLYARSACYYTFICRVMVEISSPCSQTKTNDS